MSKIITISELRANASTQSLWMLVQGKVYNVTKFIDDHPGGDEVMLGEAGRDATSAFEDVGHSDEARALLPDLFVGDFEQDSVKKLPPTATHTDSKPSPTVQKGSSNLMYFIPLGLLGAYFGWRYYSSGSL